MEIYKANECCVLEINLDAYECPNGERLFCPAVGQFNGQSNGQPPDEATDNQHEVD